MMDKVLIESASYELLELFSKVSEEAKKEKNAVPPINKVVYWWTRKPLVVGKAVILASTMTNIDDVEKLLGLGEKRSYNYIPDHSVYKRKTKLGRIKVLDPFGGAGNLLFSPARLGLDCYCSDYNPMAYLIERSILEFPLTYGPTLADDFTKCANEVIDLTYKEVGQFYGKNDLVYLWSWCIRCPHCNQRFPLTNHMYVARTLKKKIGIEVHLESDNFSIKLVDKISKINGSKFTQKGGKAICPRCTNTIDYDVMTDDIAKRKDRELICVQIQSGKTRQYVEPNAKDRSMFKKSGIYIKSKLLEYEKDDLIPTEDILPSHRRENTTWHYGIKLWKEFFSHRQLLVASTFLKNIQHVCKEIPDKKLVSIMSIYLGFLLCKHVDLNCFGTRWNTGGEKLEGALSMRRPSIVYNHAEVNPFQKIRGSLPNTVKNISDAISFAGTIKKSVNINLESVLSKPKSSKKYDLIITDPPYLDDVQYGELSEFLYVWLYRATKNFFKELPPRAPLTEDLCESWGRFKDKKLAHEFFKKGFKKAFVAMNNILEDDGMMVVFFAHSTTQAWNILLQSLRDARFRVVSSYAFHTESTTNVLARNKASFMSSVVVVCRKINRDSVMFYEDMKPDMEDIIKDTINAMPQDKLLAMPITDLLIMVYGKVLEVATQHTELKSYQKNYNPDFEELLEYSREVIMKQIVSKITERSMNMIGPTMAFYLLVKIFHAGVLVADEAKKIAMTFGLDEREMTVGGGLAYRDGSSIHLEFLHKHEINKKLEDIDVADLHQQLSYIASTIHKEGSARLQSILTSANLRTSDIKHMIDLIIKGYRLRQNRNESLSPDEQIELGVLTTFSDATGGLKPKGGTLESFFDEK